MRFEAGAELGRYKIEALLGEGGMGEVYRAYDTLLHRKVALKILRAAGNDGTADARRAVERILREARVAAALHHPNAVSIFDLGEHEGVHFLAMELVAGRPLREFVGRSDIPLEQRARWLADVGRALDAAHRAGIVHLDIKPENILVRSDTVVKVLDFGIARTVAFDHDPLAPHAQGNVQASTMSGTPRYMAPEQVRRLKLDGRTDQFSWGVVAYELLTGAAPWGEDQSLFDTFFAITHESPPSLRLRNVGVPAPLDAVVMRALAKEPAKRYPSMGAIVDAIEQVFPKIAPTPSWIPKALPSVTSPAQATLPDARSSGQEAIVTAEDPRGITTLEAPSGPLSSPKTTATTTLDAAQSPPPERPLPSVPETVENIVTGANQTPATAPSPEARPSLLRRFSLGALALGALSAVFIGGRALLASRAPTSPMTAPSAPATAPLVPTTMTDLPAPSGCNAAALAEYRTGLQTQHDGDWNEAHASFERAVKADPDCAAAHLRLTMTAYSLYPPSRTREVYQRALQLRAALGERDRLLLDALDPLVRSDPADEHAYATRLKALSERFPGDAELVGLAAEYATDNDARLAAARAALALDPHYSDAFQLVASTLRWQGKLDASRAALDDCILAAPSSIDCIQERIVVARAEGRCDQMDENARRWVTKAPKSAAAYATLARAIAAQGGAVELFAEALRQRWSRMPEPSRAQAEPLEQAHVDALAGRFDHALAEAREAARLVENDPSYESHAGPTLLLVNVLLETGETDKAAAIAADFLGRRGVWASSLRVVTTFHLEPLLIDTEREAHKIGDAEWRKKRDAWSAAATAAGGRLSEETRWALDVAMPVRTPAEAVEAVRHMPTTIVKSSVPGQDLSGQVLTTSAFAGRALLLAGEIDEAIKLLRRATTHCDALEIPFEDTRENLWLGQALEKKGDTQGACAAYRVVTRRFGDATPPSVTAGVAKRRTKALRCDP